MASALSRYVGGIYIDRSFVGQENAKQPYTPVPVDYQKKALEAISHYIFAPNAFDADTYLFPYLQPQRRGYNFFGRTEDPKPEQLAGFLQSSVMNYWFYPATLQRMNSTTLYGNTYSSAEVLKDISAMIFDEDLKTDVNLYRQNAQTDLVKKLANVLTDPRYDNVSKASALNTLYDIRMKLGRAKSNNEQTKAHRANLSFLIEKALVIK